MKQLTQKESQKAFDLKASIISLHRAWSSMLDVDTLIPETSAVTCDIIRDKIYSLTCEYEDLTETILVIE